MINYNFRQKGFTLIEMAIVLLIMGLIVGAIFSFLSVARIEQQQQITVTREQKIADALAYFAQMHNQLPCPGLPDATVQGDPVSTCVNIADRSGIVPYRLLGLSQEEVTDGFGNPISYTVSQLAANRGSTAEAACRLPSWMTNGSSAPNLNQPKASFCCGNMSNPSLRVYMDLAKTSVSPLQTGDGQFANPNIMAGSSSATTQSYIAYVLVSHGRNGMGSFSFCQPGAVGCNHARKAVNNAGQLEQWNANDGVDDRYAAMANSSGGTDNFDDIVLWRTQDRVISEFNNDSCAKP